MKFLTGAILPQKLSPSLIFAANFASNTESTGKDTAAGCDERISPHQSGNNLVEGAHRKFRRRFARENQRLIFRAEPVTFVETQTPKSAVISFATRSPVSTAPLR